MKKILMLTAMFFLLVACGANSNTPLRTSLKTISYSYDSEGNFLSDQTTTNEGSYSYKSGKLTEIKYDDGSTVEYTYNSDGNVAEAKAASYMTRYSYDTDEGAIVTEEYEINDNGLVSDKPYRKNVYDKDNNILASYANTYQLSACLYNCEIAGVDWFTMWFDAENMYHETYSDEWPYAYITTPEYDDEGRIIKKTVVFDPNYGYVDNDYETYEYNEEGLLTRVETFKNSSLDNKEKEQAANWGWTAKYYMEGTYEWIGVSEPDYTIKEYYYDEDNSDSYSTITESQTSIFNDDKTILTRTKIQTWDNAGLSNQYVYKYYLNDDLGLDNYLREEFYIDGKLSFEGYFDYVFKNKTYSYNENDY